MYAYEKNGQEKERTLIRETNKWGKVWGYFMTSAGLIFLDPKRTFIDMKTCSTLIDNNKWNSYKLLEMFNSVISEKFIEIWKLDVKGQSSTTYKVNV